VFQRNLTLNSKALLSLLPLATFRLPLFAWVLKQAKRGRDGDKHDKCNCSKVDRKYFPKNKYINVEKYSDCATIAGRMTTSWRVVVNLLRQGFSCPNERSFPVLFASAKYWSSRPSFKTSMHIGPWSWQILFSIQVVVKVNCLTVYCESSSAHFCGVRFVTWNLLSCWWWIWKQFNSLLVDSWTFEARLLRPSWDKLSVQVKKLAWTPTCLLSPYHFSNESKTKQNDMQKLK